jgi:hypothetical protein
MRPPVNRYVFHQPKPPRPIDIGQEWHFINKIDPFKIIDMAEGKWKVRFTKRQDEDLFSTEYILKNCCLYTYSKEPIELDTQTLHPRTYRNQQGNIVVKKKRSRAIHFDSGYYYGGKPVEIEWTNKAPGGRGEEGYHREDTY